MKKKSRIKELVAFWLAKKKLAHKIVPKRVIVNNASDEKYLQTDFNFANKSNGCKGSEEKNIGKSYLVPFRYPRTGLDIRTASTLGRHLVRLRSKLTERAVEKWKSKILSKCKSKGKGEVSSNRMKVLEKLTNEIPSYVHDYKVNNPRKEVENLKNKGLQIASVRVGDISKDASENVPAKHQDPNGNKNSSENKGVGGLHKNAVVDSILPVGDLDGGNESGRAKTKLSPKIVGKIKQTLNYVNAFSGKIHPGGYGLVADHRFPESRMGKDEPFIPNMDMSAEDIIEHFQLCTTKQNLVKRSACKRCVATGERGVMNGASFVFKGGVHWDPKIPQFGAGAEKGCEGCYFYDPVGFRKAINKNK